MVFKIIDSPNVIYSCINWHINKLKHQTDNECRIWMCMPIFYSDSCLCSY